MIVVGFGVALIAILVFCKVLSLVQPKLKNSQAFVYLINYSAMDRILRIVQYIASGLYGTNLPDKNSLYLHFGLVRFIPLQSLVFLSFLMGYGRKVLRIARAPLCLMSMVANRQIMRVNPFKATIKQLSSWCFWYGDLADMIFYFTDHFHGLYLLGLVSNHDLCDQLELVGHFMWIINAFFYFFGFALSVSIHSSRKEITLTEREGRKIKQGLLEMLSNFFEFILGFCFIYPEFMSRQMISLMVLISSVAKLYKLSLK